MDAKKLLTIILTLFLFGFSSEPNTNLISFNTNILLIQAKAGDTKAQYQLATYYESGIGVKHSRKYAKKWYRHAALNGHIEAQINLGRIYRKDKKYSQAIEWFEQAANQKHPRGLIELANLYELGLGVLQNKKKAYELYLQAAELGDVRAMFKLAQTLGSGQIGQKDEYQGCVWSYLAEQHLTSNQFSVQYRTLRHDIRHVVNQCDQKLPENQLMSAKKAALDWQPRVFTSNY